MNGAGWGRGAPAWEFAAFAHACGPNWNGLGRGISSRKGIDGILRALQVPATISRFLRAAPGRPSYFPSKSHSSSAALFRAPPFSVLCRDLANNRACSISCSSALKVMFFIRRQRTRESCEWQPALPGATQDSKEPLKVALGSVGTPRRVKLEKTS